MQRRILVHAGFHKTGTSTIQGFLRSNRRALRPWFIPFAKEAFPEVGKLTRIFGQRPFPWRKRAIRRGLRDFLASVPDGHNIVLSREALLGAMPGYEDWRGRRLAGYPAAPALTKILRAELVRRFPDAEISWLFTTRDHDAWVRSIWGHHVRTTDITESAESFAASVIALPSTVEIAAALAKHLAPQRVITAPLEEISRHPCGPAGAVLDAMSVPVSAYAKFNMVPAANVGPDPQQAEHMLSLNALGGSGLQETKRKLMGRRPR